MFCSQATARPYCATADIVGFCLGLDVCVCWLAAGILKAINVNRLTKAGCVFKFWVADWFALLNNKMGGDLKKIRTVGQYMIEVRCVEA